MFLVLQHRTHISDVGVSDLALTTLVKTADCPELNYRVTDKPFPRGEVWVRGPCVFKGYYKDPAATSAIRVRLIVTTHPHSIFHWPCRAAMRAGEWLRTGDIGMWDADNSLRIIDRKKSIFKMAQGEYVCPEHTEQVYASSSLVAQVGLAVLSSGRKGREKELVITTDPHPQRIHCQSAPRNGDVCGSLRMEST